MEADADVLIVGAGPVGLFAAFQLGLFGISGHVVDSLDRPGGQCAVYYADKPIYDAPGHPAVLAGELVDALVRQASSVALRLTLGCPVIGVAQGADGRLAATSADGRTFAAAAIVLAAGDGSFVADGARRGDAGTWGLPPDRWPLPVDPATQATGRPGLFAIGDACTYPGKLRLLACGFHEAAMMTQAVRRLIRPSARSAARPPSPSSALREQHDAR